MSAQPKMMVSPTGADEKRDSSDPFRRSREMTPKEMDDLMMSALVSERVNIVDGLLQRGCSMEKFITAKRLEDLYNAHKPAKVNIFQILMKRLITAQTRYSLKDVGWLIEKLIGGSYTSPYARKNLFEMDKCGKTPFTRPFNDLMVWAILTMRKEMAIYFWQRGEDTIAKSLVAVKLYKACSEEIWGFDSEEAATLAENAKEFERLSVEVLNHCYLADDDKTLLLLTYDLKGWQDQTCLGLAVAAENKPFLAHPCCQILLADLWHGAMSIRKQDLIRVLLVLICPLLAFLRLIQFKTKGELVLQAKGGKRAGINLNLTNVGQAADKTQLTCREKVKEFIFAPITVFWIWTLSYITFLAAFTFMVLIKTPEEGPLFTEYYVITYAVTYCLELLRRIVISEPRKCREKIVMFCRDLWQLSALLATLALIAGFVLRFFPEYVSVARVVYACDIAYWYLRILELIEVSSIVGPYLVIIAKMLSSTIYMVAILLVILWSFGVLRQAILIPDREEFQWMIVRDVTYKTYFMWYGEVYAEEIDECGDKGVCVPGSWIATLACSIYLLLTNIILINLLIAMFNHIYTETSAVSTQVWKFRRYRLVVEYEQHPCLPPPFVLLYHFYWLVQCMLRCCFKKCRKGGTVASEYTLKLMLNDHDIENLLDFEEECMEDLAAQKELTIFYSQKERMKRVTERQENMSKQLDNTFASYDGSFGCLTGLLNKIKALDRVLRAGKGGIGSPPLDDTSLQFGTLMSHYPFDSSVTPESAKSQQQRRRTSSREKKPRPASQ